MAESARVTSFDAVRAFREQLSAFCEEAKDALGAVRMEIRRLQGWLERDQLAYWQHMIRKKEEELTQAKADLFRKQLSRISGDRKSVV